MKEKGIGYWDLIKELYRGIVDTKPNGDSSTLKQLWDTTAIGELQKFITKSDKDKSNIDSVINGTAFGSSSILIPPRSFHTGGKERMRIDSNGNASFPNWQDVLWNDMNKKMLTIKNPEKLNTGDNLISNEWGITYGGRDLSLDMDNYYWIITNRKTGLKGYYIIERELIQNDWVYIRWGREKVTPKERRETIDKSRLKDKDIIQRDMVVAVITSIGHNL